MSGAAAGGGRARRRRWRFPVESSQVLQLSRALGIPDGDRSHDERPVPPTFLVAADRFDPGFERRPRAGAPWPGSGRDVPPGPAAGERGGSTFQAGEHITYHRAPRIGEVLEAERREGRTWTRRGRRGGRLVFREEITELRDADGAPVVTGRWISVTTEHSVADDGG